MVRAPKCNSTRHTGQILDKRRADFYTAPILPVWVLRIILIFLIPLQPDSLKTRYLYIPGPQGRFYLLLGQKMNNPSLLDWLGFLLIIHSFDVNCCMNSLRAGYFFINITLCITHGKDFLSIIHLMLSDVNCCKNSPGSRISSSLNCANLINIWQTFNVGTDAITAKPYIQNKSLFQWIYCKCLAW